MILKSRIWLWASTTAATIIALFIVPGISFSGGGIALAVALVATVVLADCCLEKVLRKLHCPVDGLVLGVLSIVIDFALIMFVSQIAAGFFGVSFALEGIATGFMFGFFIGAIVFFVNCLLGVESRSEA